MARILSGNMKFLVLFAVAALFGSVLCDQECFRAAMKECMMEPVPSEKMRLCNEVTYQIECLSQMAFDCEIQFTFDIIDLHLGVERVCVKAFGKYFDKDKACYKRAINDSVCVEPIIEAMSDLTTTQDFIRANKKICNLFEPYLNCVKKNVEKDCNGTVLSMNFFNSLYDPLRKLSNSLCEQLILPADVEDSRPDNFGMLNVYKAIIDIFDTA